MKPNNDFFELFKNDFTKEFNKRQQEGQLQGVILTEWTAPTATNFFTRYVLFGLDSRDEEETKTYLEFNYHQIKDFYNDDSVGHKNRDHYIKGSLDKLNGYYSKLKKINNW